MFGFSKKKKQKQQELDRAFDSLMEDINAIDRLEDPNKIHRYILESCEQIISRAKIIKKEKAEYKVLSNYISDIKTITNQDERSKKRLQEVAQNILDLEKTRFEFQRSERRLPTSVFAVMEENERDIPETIRTMQENERYQSSVLRDMQKLEAKKNEYEIELDRLREGDETKRKLAFLGLILFGSVTAFLLLIHFATSIDTTWGVLAVGFICVMLLLGQEYHLRYTRRERRELSRSMNKTISLLNVVRMKYANVTAQIDYEKDKYEVTNSYELNYLWERYMADVRDLRQYEQDNEDYVYFNHCMTDILKSLDLNDVTVWQSQTAALVNPADMQEVYRKLDTRRKKVRAMLEENMRYVQEERDEVARLMREHNYYENELIEIIATIDDEMGLNKNYTIIKAQGAKKA